MKMAKSLKLCEGGTGDLLIKHYRGSKECSSGLKKAILSEIDRGFDADFVSRFLNAVCNRSASEFLCEQVWSGNSHLMKLDEKLYFFLYPDFGALREYCYFHKICLLRVLRNAVKKEGTTPSKFASKYGYSFKRLLESYNSTFEGQDIDSWIKEGAELVTFCDLFRVKLDTLAASPADWNLEEDCLEESLDNLFKGLRPVAFSEHESLNDFVGSKKEWREARRSAAVKTAKNFARLFSLPPDKWYGEKYFHRLMR